MTRIMFETFNVPVGAVVRLRRHRRHHWWMCPQLPASAGRTVLLWSRTGSSTRRAQEMLPGKPSRQALCERALHAEVPAVRVEKVTLNVQHRTDLRKSAGETCGEAGRPLDAEQTWGHRFLEACSVGARSVARRVRFVHRTRADRIEMAEERKDWIFVLDLDENMAETIMTQQKKIKTVTWTEQATRVHWPVLFILANMARTSRVLLETTRLAVTACYRFRFAGDRQEWSQQLHLPQHGKTRQVYWACLN